MSDPDNIWSVRMSLTDSRPTEREPLMPSTSGVQRRYNTAPQYRSPTHAASATQYRTMPHGSNLLDGRPTTENIRINRQTSTQSADKEDAHVPEHMLLNAEFESLDYDTCENVPYQRTERALSYRFVIKRQLARWFVMLWIGILTAFTACFIDVCIDQVAVYKFWLVKTYVDSCVTEGCLYRPLLIWVAFNAVAVFIASMLVVFGEPCAAGSGIPQIKCFLNGVKIPHVVRVKTLVCKVLGVIFSVIGGLCVGKEGPMIHSGAVIAAGISQGRSTTFRLDMKLFEYFRTDTEKRDFVSGGAAAGVAAAFGAPVGGVLFSLEEGASFWNQSLTWRIFFTSLVSTFTLNVVFSYYHGHPWELSYPGLINFGQFGGSLDWNGEEIPIYLLMGAIGGLFGALFNFINTKLTIFRMQYVYRPLAKITEAMIVAMITANIFFLLIYVQRDCQPLGKDPTETPLQFFCYDGEYNAIGAIFLQTPETAVKSLFHDPDGAYRPATLVLFFIAYFLLSCWTYGLSVSSGLFIPSLLAGAAWGRAFGALIKYIFPNAAWAVPGKYALIGAAAQLGGIVRMTISLTVILIEATKNISFGLPLMIVLMVAKWVGDFFNEGIYDIHIQLQGVPLLVWDPPPITSNILAMEVMSHPVSTIRTVEKVGRIMEILKRDRHDGFPVVQDFDPDGRDVGTFGTFKGLILRTQLIVLLKNKVFTEPGQELYCRKTLSSEDFRETYPRFPSVSQIHVSAHEQSCVVDLRPYMNPAPYMVLHTTSLPRIFRLFRGLGLRHLVVVNHHNEVVGIVTRKDLARYRVWNHRGRMGVEELQVSHG